VLLLSCSAPMPCQFPDTAGPEHWTGTFELTAPGMMHTGTIDVSVASNVLLETGDLSTQGIDTYLCRAPAIGTLTFDDGRVVQLTGEKTIYLESTSVTGSAAGTSGPLELRGGAYSLTNSAPVSSLGFSGDIDIDRSGDSVGHWEIHE
jgi:hypothetical protein